MRIAATATEARSLDARITFYQGEETISLPRLMNEVMVPAEVLEDAYTAVNASLRALGAPELTATERTEVEYV